MRDQYCENNTSVKRGRDYVDFLSVSIRTEAGDEHPSEVAARICRYTCPGRYDTYSFALCEGGRIMFRTDTETPLPIALKMVQEDLRKPQVRRVLESFRGKGCGRLANGLIASLSPRHPFVRKVNRWIEEARALRLKKLSESQK